MGVGTADFGTALNVQILRVEREIRGFKKRLYFWSSAPLKGKYTKKEEDTINLVEVNYQLQAYN